MRNAGALPPPTQKKERRKKAGFQKFQLKKKKTEETLN